MARKENKMGTMPIGRLLLTMSAPLVASMLFQALYNIVDSVFVARLGQDAMNAVSLAFPMQSLLIAFSSGTGIGINALLSRSLGAKDNERADRAANTGILLYIITAAVFTVIGVSFAGLYYRLQTQNPAIIDYGTAYLRICLGFSAALFGQMCFERLLQATGRTELAMIPQITGAVLNMIFDPILIFGLFGFPRLEVAGAAVATVFGQSVALAIGIMLNIKKNREINLSFNMMRLHGETAAEIYKVAVPSIIMGSIGSFMNFGLNKILIGFTEAATAVFGAYYKIQSFIFMPVFGMNGAIVPIISYNHGAGNNERYRQTAKYAIITAIVIMSVGTVLFEAVPDTLIGVFSPSEEMLRVGRVAFRVIGAHFPVAGFCIVAGSVCQALRKPLYSMIVSICRQLLILLPAAYLLSLTGKLELVWFAFLIAEVASLIMNIFFLRSAFRDAEKQNGI